MQRLRRTLVVLALGSLAAFGQSVVSARSGMIHLVQGRVFLDDEAVRTRFGQFPEVKENQVLRTGLGRAEVILTPGVFLRVAEQSSFRMVTNRLIDTRLEFLTGSAVIEAGDIPKDNAVTVVMGDAEVRLLRRGVYRFDSDPPAVRVFDGRVQVAAGGREVAVKGGRMLALGPELAALRFDKEQTDALDRWSRRRAEYVAMANISAANSIRRSGNSWMSSGWAWNPYFGMFTFVPMSGTWHSPYGFRYWSPRAVYAVYRPRVISVVPSGSGHGSIGGYARVPRAASASGRSGAITRGASPGGAATASPAGNAGAGSRPVSRGGSARGGRR